VIVFFCARADYFSDMAKKLELSDFTRSGLEKHEADYLNPKSDSQTLANNPFYLRHQEKIKKKEINTSTPRSNKENKELKLSIVEEVNAEWEKMQTERDGTPKSLRGVRKGPHDRETEQVTSRPGTPALIPEDSTKRKRTPEQEEEIAKRKREEKEIEDLRIHQAFLEGRIMELEKTQVKLEKENERLRNCEIKLAQTQTKLEEREIELDKQERNISQLKHEAIQGSLRIKELEITNEQIERSKEEIEGKMRELQEDIKKLCTENGTLKATKGQSGTTAPVVSFADMLKRDTAKIPEKTRLIV